jgi:hypothetical protein
VILLDALDETVLVFVVVNVDVVVNDADAVVLVDPDEEPESEYDSTFVIDAIFVIDCLLVIDDDPVIDGDGDELNVLNDIVGIGVFVLILYVADTVGVYVFVIVCTIYVNVLDGVDDNESVFVFISVLLMIDVLLDVTDTVDVFDTVDVLDIVFVYIILTVGFAEVDTVGDLFDVFDCDMEPVLVGVLDTVFVVLVDFVFEADPVDVFDI